MSEKKLTGNEIREMFLKFFEEKHNSTRVASSSLVPDNPTVLLTTAGMLQFLPYYLGLEKPPFEPARATSCQKCARAGGKDSDIENVGRTPRHHTFFEMLGNFAFGDYYKKDVIPWSWDFVTNYLKLDPKRLWVTIYESDDEAYDIWTKDVGVSPERVLRKGKKDNFWGPPGATGSCGPCSEIHYDLGEHLKCSDDCSIATCECDRWVEIWNLVFTELFQDEEGNFSPLDKKNVDTGMGLERISMVVQGKESTFETDLLYPILKKVSEMSNVLYKANLKSDVSLRIITDHARCVTFMINDGILPGNEGRNYVLRMILRRALRHGKLLGLELPFLDEVIDVVINQYKFAYPELETNAQKIKNVIRKEEEKFKITLDRGYKLLEELMLTSNKISGEDAFKLYDTFGFPLELTIEIAAEKGVSVDKLGFEKAMKEQKDRAKAAVQKIVLTEDLVYVDFENKHGGTEFLGYEKDEVKAQIAGWVEAEDYVDVMLDKTPFYAESGGQVGDSGIIFANNLKLEVITTFKVNKLFVHRCNLLEGDLKEGQEVVAKIDLTRRKLIEAHHTNAHLLQAALIKVLGNEVKQAGSFVNEYRTRFDFSFSRAMTKGEIQKVEDIINKWICNGYNVSTEIMDIEKAKTCGAMALFGEKYDDKVRVVSVGNEDHIISKELCGGTHVKNISQIRLVKIISESAISAGSRRIEVACSKAALDYLNEKASILDELSHKFKAQTFEVIERVDKLILENKNLNSEISTLKEDLAKNKFATLVERAKEFKDGKLFINKVDSLDNEMLKVGIEHLGTKLGDSIVVLANVCKDNVVIVVRVSEALVKKGYAAGKIINEIMPKLNGRGGGRPNFAQGSAKNCSNLNEVLEGIEKDILG